jgi:hypothetical protein
LEQWQGIVSNHIEITAAGTVQDSHLIPYYPNPEYGAGTITVNKDRKNKTAKDRKL